MNFTLLVAVLLTAIAFVGIVIALSNAIAPVVHDAQMNGRTNVVFPPAVNHGMQFRVGYYLFAICF